MLRPVFVMLIASGVAVALWFGQGVFAPERPEYDESTDFAMHRAVGCWEFVGSSDRSGIIPIPQAFSLKARQPNRAPRNRLPTNGEITGAIGTQGPLSWELYWIPDTPQNSAYIAWGTGLRGAFGRFAIGDSVLSGRLWLWTDLVGPRLGRRSTWRRVSCVNP